MTLVGKKKGESVEDRSFMFNVDFMEEKDWKSFQ